MEEYEPTKLELWLKKPLTTNERAAFVFSTTIGGIFLLTGFAGIIGWGIFGR